MEHVTVHYDSLVAEGDPIPCCSSFPSARTTASCSHAQSSVTDPCITDLLAVRAAPECWRMICRAGPDPSGCQLTEPVSPKAVLEYQRPGYDADCIRS
jgi:hypothetical protein